MLATLANPLAQSPSVFGLRDWVPDQVERTAAMVKSGAAKRKAVVYSNMVCNPFDAVHNIMFSYGEFRDSNYVNTAIYKFGEDDWNFLELASGELARLSRMSDVLPGFLGMIKNPTCILYNFNSRNERFLESLRSWEDGQLPENVLRYRLAMYVAAGGKIFTIFSHNCDKPLARAICAILFSRPYRQDWLECDLHELEDDASYLGGLFRKHSGAFVLDAWTSEISHICFSIANFNLYNLIMDCQVFRQLARKSGNSDAAAYVEPKARISFSGIPSWFAENLDIREASWDISPLPPTAMAIRVNPASGAVVPMYPALDECDIPIALVPESKSVWYAMIRIYHMSTHDELYPESPSAQIMLSPQDAHFPQEMAERYNLIYLGLQSLGGYVEEIRKLEENGENPDYQFHAFAIEEKDGVRRNRR